jgi:hypothetical protein
MILNEERWQNTLAAFKMVAASLNLKVWKKCQVEVEVVELCCASKGVLGSNLMLNLKLTCLVLLVLHLINFY